MNNSTDPQNLYDLFKNGYQDGQLIANVGIRWICATLGAFSNFSLVYVTVKSKNLRSACNILIALDSLCAGFYELSVTNTFFVVLSGLNFIPLRSCFPLQFVPLLGFFLSQGAMLFIALDRLLCMLAPIWVNKNQRKHKRALVPLMASLCAAYAVYALSRSIAISTTQGDTLVQCGTGDCYPGDVGNELNRNQLILMGATVLCYPIIFLIFLYRKGNGTAHGSTISYHRKMIKSLVAIVVVLLGSQVLGALCRIFGFRPSAATSTVTFLLANGQVCLNYLVYGCNAPILYALSSEYRKAFNAVFLAKWNVPIHGQTTNSHHRTGPNGQNARTTAN